MPAIVYNKCLLLLINLVSHGDSVCVRRPRVPPDRVSSADRTVRYILVAAVGSGISPSEEKETVITMSEGPSNDSYYRTRLERDAKGRQQEC